MDGRSRAYIEVLLCRSACHGAQLAEDQVAHWVLDGVASLGELREARERTQAARRALSKAQRMYVRECTRAALARG